MSRITDKQIIELMTRRNVDPRDGRFISRKQMQDFLSGRLFPTPQLGDPKNRMISIGWQVDRMVAAGFHVEQGLSEAEYRALWPEAVMFPDVDDALWSKYHVCVVCVDETPRITLTGLMGGCVNETGHELDDFLTTNQGIMGCDGVARRYVMFCMVRPYAEYIRRSSVDFPYDRDMSITQSWMYAFFHTGGIYPREKRSFVVSGAYLEDERSQRFAVSMRLRCYADSTHDRWELVPTETDEYTVVRMSEVVVIE